MGNGAAGKLEDHRKLCESVTDQYFSFKQKQEELSFTSKRNELRNTEKYPYQHPKGNPRNEYVRPANQTSSPRRGQSTRENSQSLAEQDKKGKQENDQNPAQEKEATKGTFEYLIHEVSKSLHRFDKLSPQDKQKYWPKAGDVVVDTYCLGIICGEVSDLLSSNRSVQSLYLEQVYRARLDRSTNKGGKTEREERREKSSLELGMEVLVMVTGPDCSGEACETMLAHPTLLPALLDRLEGLKKTRLTHADQTLLLDGVNLLQNLAVFVAEDQDGYDGLGASEGISQAHSKKMVAVLKSCLKKSDEELKLLAQTALACMDEAVLREEDVQYLCLSLSLALGERSQEGARCSIIAMERGIRHLLVSAKEISGKGALPVLVQCGAVRLLMKGASSNVVLERKTCLDCLRHMCLKSSQSRKDVLEDDAFIDFLHKVRNQKLKNTDRKTEDEPFQCDKNENVCREIAGLILIRLERHVELESQGKSDDSRKLRAQYVMLSYEAESEPVMSKIKDYLRSEDILTYTTNNRTEDTKSSDDMVDGATVFVMGVTEKYNNSTSCRREANRADARGIYIKPLLLEKDYKPTGWLGLLTANKTFFEIADKNPSDGELKRLEGELRKLLKKEEKKEKEVKREKAHERGTESNQPDSSRTQPNMRTRQDEASKTPREVVWVAPYCRQHPNADGTPREENIGYIYTDPKKEVRDWAKRFNLDGQLVKTLSKKDLDGLVFLKEQAPTFFYKRIWKDLKMKKLSEVKQFEDALDFWQQNEETINQKKKKE